MKPEFFTLTFKLALTHLLAAMMFVLAIIMTGCASSSKGETTMMLPDRDAASSADGAAYTADSMHFGKPMPSRPNWKPMEFYYKHCTEADNKSYYSKTDYDCNGP